MYIKPARRALETHALEEDEWEEEEEPLPAPWIAYFGLRVTCRASRDERDARSESEVRTKFEPLCIHNRIQRLPTALRFSLRPILYFFSRTSVVHAALIS